MTLLSKVAQATRKLTGRSSPRLLTVKSAGHLTPHMIRVVFAGAALEGIPNDCAGGNCKLMLPEPGEAKELFASRLQNGPAPVRRTYTVRHFDPVALELTIDFVAHGDTGPASRWASHAKPGDFLGFAGPSAPKITRFNADWYLVAADLSALPVAAVALEAMPRDAKGVAIFEVTTPEDRQDIEAPIGIEVHWLIHPDPHTPSAAQVDFIRSMAWAPGRVQTCIAGESGVIKALRSFVMNEKKLIKEDVYISGYWKIGLVEDDHQQAKRDGTA